MIDAKHVAKLARLKISAQEEQNYQKQLSSVLENFQEISKVDTEGVEPLVTPTEIPQFLREDIVIAGDGAESALSNAPEKSGNLFKVPPVV